MKRRFILMLLITTMTTACSAEPVKESTKIKKYHVDEETGCEYIIAPDGNGMSPRYERRGDNYVIKGCH